MSTLLNNDQKKYCMHNNIRVFSLFYWELHKEMYKERFDNKEVEKVIKALILLHNINLKHTLFKKISINTFIELHRPNLIFSFMNIS